jgi:hypothetical protein
LLGNQKVEFLSRFLTVKKEGTQLFGFLTSGPILFGQQGWQHGIQVFRPSRGEGLFLFCYKKSRKVVRMIIMKMIHKKYFNMDTWWPISL